MKKTKHKRALIFIGLFGVAGAALILFSHAAILNNIIEPEAGSAAGKVTSVTNSGASGGAYVQFDTCSTSGAPGCPTNPVPPPLPTPSPTPSGKSFSSPLPISEKKLILAQTTGHALYPTFQQVKDNLSKFDSIPYDGVGLVDSSNHWQFGLSGGVYSVDEFRAGIQPYKDIAASLKKVKHNFYLIRIQHYGDLTQAKSKLIQNMSNLAEAAKDSGLEGIIYDNEDYLNQSSWRNPATPPMFVPSSACPGQTRENCKKIAYDIGIEVMKATVAKWPTVKVLAMHSPAISVESARSELMQGHSADYFLDLANYDVLGAYTLGLGAGTINTQAVFIDGSESDYDVHSNAEIARSLSARDTVLPRDSNLLSSVYKAEWSKQISQASALYSNTQNASPDVWRNDIKNRKPLVDEYVWVYDENYDWIKMTGVSAGVYVPDSWRQATIDGWR